MYKRILRAATFGVIVLLASACASTDGSAGGRSSSSLSQEELLASDASNVYDAVMRLRPRWLEQRTFSGVGGTAGQIVVFLNNSYLGGPTELRQFGIREVYRIRYLDSAQANAELRGFPTGTLVTAGIVMETSDRR